LRRNGCQEGEGETRRMTLRVIELVSDYPERAVLESVIVEEYDVW
jgi:hypothetical protein